MKVNIKKLISILMMVCIAALLFGCNDSKKTEKLVYKNDLFAKGMIGVEKDGKFGILNSKGKILVPFDDDYTDATIDARSGLVILERSKEYEEYGTYQLYNPKKDDYSIGPVNDISFSRDSNNLLICDSSDSDDDTSDDVTYYFVNQNGDRVIKKEYKHANPFSGGLAAVSESKDEESQPKYGFINEKGEYVIKPRFTIADMFCGGVAAVGNEKESVFLIDKNGNRITDKIYDTILINYIDDKNPMWSVCKNRKYGLINAEGEEIVKPIYDTVAFDGTLIYITKNGKHGVLDSDGETLIEPKYDYINIDSFSDIRAFKKNKKWGFVNNDGKEVVKPKYEESHNFYNNDLCPVKLNGKWGYINKSGKTVIPFKYDEAEEYNKGIATVVYNGNCYAIDKKGNITKTFNNEYKKVCVYGDSFLAVTKDKKFEIMNREYKVIGEKYDRFKNQFGQTIGICKKEGCYNFVTTDKRATTGQLCEEHDPLFDKQAD